VDITLLDNDQRTVRDAVEEACAGAASVRIAVAFAKGSGLAAAPALEKLVARGGGVRVLAGVDFQLTDLDALLRFERPPSAARVYLHPDASGKAVFHPKVYLFESSEGATALVGSSNLTAGGLAGNVEANLLIRADPNEPVVQHVRAFHARLWNSGLAFQVTPRFRDHYAQLQQKRHEVELSLRAEADFSRAQRELRAAVVEAVTSYRSGAERHCWLLITSPENYIRNIQGRIWGDENRRRIAQVKPGDLIYFYITRPMMVLGAMGVVTRETYEDQPVHWRDGRVYPYRFGFTPMLQPETPVPFRPLVASLDLFGRKADSTWGQRLQASMRSLSPHDCEVLRTALVTATDGAEVA